MARALGQAVEVDQHIDLVGDNLLGRFFVVGIAKAARHIKARQHFTAQRRIVVVAGAVGVELEAFAVVVAHHAQRQQAGGVVAVVTGQVADTQLALGPARPGRRDQRRLRGEVFCSKGRDHLDVGRLVGTPQQVGARRFGSGLGTARGMLGAQARRNAVSQLPVGTLQGHAQGETSQRQGLARSSKAAFGGLQRRFVLPQAREVASSLHQQGGAGLGFQQLQRCGNRAFAVLLFIQRQGQR